MSGYYLPFTPDIDRSQDYGANPGVGPNPPGGHNGDDWATPIGTPVRAAGDGEVVFAGEFDSTYADNWGWNLNYGGKMVILNMDGPTGPYFEYGHNSRLMVKAGDRVAAGQIIAYTGNSDGGTGVSTGPHCHVGALPPNFDLNTNTYGRVNPRIYMTEYWDEDTATAQAIKDEQMTPEQNRMLVALYNAFFNKKDGKDDNQSIVGGEAIDELINKNDLDTHKRIDAVDKKLDQVLQKLG